MLNGLELLLLSSLVFHLPRRHICVFLNVLPTYDHYSGSIPCHTGKLAPESLFHRQLFLLKFAKWSAMQVKKHGYSIQNDMLMEAVQRMGWLHMGQY